MTRKRHTEEQIIAVLKDAQAGLGIQELCRKHGMSEREIAESKRRSGCPRIYVRLRREGWRVNHKKVERIYYREEGLS